ncbi:MAG: YhgE/Pip domain-containing protein [Arcanobacterium sp.]|nr:YhgE/Pip domain-containing protein [Arcanobacterium sp.]
MKRTKHYRLMLSVVVILPMFFFLALLGANTEQLSTYGSPQAAIVNNDSPVTLTTGQILPAGRQVIATLTDPKRETRFEWAVVSSASAENGLKDGTYEAVVDIPQNFSASVAGILQSTSTTPGTLIVRTNGTSALLADLSNDIVSAAGKDLSTSFTVSYLTESLAATSQIKDGFSQAADGAGQLADGARQLADGNAQLADGAAELASGVSQLSAGTQPLHAGASALASGLRQYVNGVNQAADGSIPLAAGAKEFAGGVAQYVNGVQQIYDGITTPQPGQSTSMLGGAQQLADALTAVASGIHSVADEIVKLLPEGITAASASAQLLSDAFDELTTLIEQCGAGDQNACAQATQGTATTAQELAKLVTQLQQVAELAEAGKINLEELTKITNPVDQLAGGARSLADGLGTLSEQMKSNMLGDNAAALTAGGTQLADGVAELSDGLGQLKAGAPQLLNGASALSGGTSELADGTSQLAGGAQALANGAREAADGTALFANGTTQAADGLGQLADGASALTDGGQQLTSGSQQLASELDKAAQQIPTYTRTDAEKTAQALGTPVSVSASSALVDPRSALAPGIIALALWLGSFGVIIYRSSMTDDKLREPFTPLALITRSLVSAIGIGAAQSLLVMIGLAVSRVPIAHLFWLIIVLLLSSFTMIALHVAFTATLGMKGGGVLSLVFLGLQLVSLSTLLPVASQSALVSALHIFLPVPQAQDALTSAITGVGSSSVAVWMLIFWFLASGFISVAAVAKRRAVSVPSLRAFAAHYWPLIRR